MSKFQGYAQGGKFDPIKMPDESQKILQQTEQTVRGMQAVRNAEAENTAGYLNSLNSNIKAEKASFENAQGMMRLNAEARKANAELIQAEDAQRKKLAGAKSEAIWKNLAEFSGKAAEVYAGHKQRKYDNDYNTEIIRLFHGDETPEQQKEILTDQFNYRNLMQLDVMTAGGARAAEIAGADPSDVADMRQRIQSTSLGAKHARADFAVSNYGGYLSKALTEDGETKIKLFNPNGEGYIDSTPNQAKSSKDIAFVSQQLMVKYLKENGMYGLKPAFLANHLKKMRGEHNKIVSQAYQNEIQLQKTNQVNEIIEKFRSKDGTAAGRFHDAHHLLKFMVEGGDKGARDVLFKEMQTTKQNINGIEYGFSDDEIEEIMQSSYLDQPNKTLAERFPSEFARIKEERQNKVQQRFDAEQEAETHAIDVYHDKLKDTFMQDLIGEGDGKIDLSLKNIELMQEEFRTLAIENEGWNKVIKTLETMKDHTDKGAEIKERVELLEENIALGAVTADEIIQNYPLLSPEKKRELAKKAKEVRASMPDKEVKKEAESQIKEALRSRVRGVGANTHYSLGIMQGVAIKKYHRDYKRYLIQHGDKDVAAENAMVDFFNEFGDDDAKGKYALDKKYKDPDGFIFGRFKHAETYGPQKTVTPDKITWIQQSIQNDPTSINNRMVSEAAIKRAAKSLNDSGRAGEIIPQIVIMQKSLKKYGGKYYSYAELLEKQLKAYDMFDSNVEASIKKAQEVENAIPERYSFLKNYPSATNTDVMVMSAGSEPVYNTNYNISATQRAGLDVLGKYESDGVGSYNAVNQIGIEEGEAVLPGSFSGPFQNMPQHRGKLLTDLTVAEIMELQSGQRSSMSNDEWIRRGKLHAVGRYQFIGDTFKAEVKRQGINVNRKFSPELQDYMALNYLRISDITRWVGPTKKASLKEKALVAAARTEPVSYGTSVWQQSRNMNPNLLARLPGNS